MEKKHENVLSLFSRNFNCSYSASFGFDCVSSVSSFEHLKDIKELLGAAHKWSWLITRAQWECQNENFEFGHLFSIVKLNFNVGLFSSLYDLSTSPAAKMRFYFLHFLQGKMPKIGPKINQIEIWPKFGFKVIISWNKSSYSNIWQMFKLKMWS